MSKSCLAAQFRRYGALEREDVALLEQLEEKEERHGPGETVQAQGTEVRRLYAVKQGWVASTCLLPDGGRQILNIYMPGDVVGFHDIPFARSVAGIHTITEAVLCPFPRARITELFRASARLAAIFFAIDMRHNALMLERLVTLGQRTAYERLCHLLLELASRMAERPDPGAQAPQIPLTQRQLAEVLGLTEVHLNRTIGQLRAEKLVEVRRGRLVLTDLPRLAAATNVEPNCLHLDLGWLEERLAGGSRHPRRGLLPAAEPSV